VEGDLVYEMVDAPGSREEVDGFLAGESNLMIGLPYDRWPDVLRRDDLQVLTYPDTAWEYLAFNLADPREPRSAFDEEGNPQEQGVHPIFGDVRVRQAVQKAIDVQAVIDAAADGYGQIMAADQIPLSFAYDPTLDPIGYDPVAAEALLEEAGWFRYGDRNTRQCRDCLHAEPESRLFVNLYYAGGYDGHYAAARVIAQQLQAVGFEVSISESSLSSIREQRFDLYLGAWGEAYPVSAGHSSLFDPAGDRVGQGNNISSYNNSELTALLDEARTLPGCDVAQRAALYADAQRILQEDQPYAWLFTYEALYAASDGIEGFAPQPQFPFWNVQEWIVWR
jgi:peptide/nickel transport system substrate-binding protein